MLKRFSGIMSNTTAYRLWQAPFADAKIAPVLKTLQRSRCRRVLDVGCGPGTNCQYFRDCDYMGVDINEQYIEYAKRKFGRHFVVQDVNTLEVHDSERFDLVLLNSLLHHLDDDMTNRLLDRLKRLLSPEGSIHIIDLVLPERVSMARFLAKNDRGDFPRPLEQWRRIFSHHFETIQFEPFEIAWLRVPLWSLIYFQGANPR